MMKETGVTLIKIGGSCFSDKKRPKSFFPEVIDFTAKAIRENGLSAIIVHGGGSFGHPIAKKYAIGSGRNPDIKDQELGFCLTHEAMEEINNMIVDRFLQHKLNAFPVQPSSIFQLDNQKICSCSGSIIKKLLLGGFVPILYGDAVLDKTRGFGILSGDKIMSYLAVMEDVSINRVVYLMDVDGIYDKNPKFKESARLFKEIVIKGEEMLVKKKDEYTRLHEEIQTDDDAIDVTGGILNKLQELISFNDKKLEINLINGRKENALNDLINGKLERYTRIKYLE